jgi:hypothetical protein
MNMRVTGELSLTFRKRKACAQALTCSLVLCSILVIHSPARESFQFGTKAGLVIAQHWSSREKPGDTTVDPGAEFGFAGGAFLKDEFRRNLALVLEVNYIEKGAHHIVTTPEFPYGEMLLTYRFNYLELSCMLRTYWIAWGENRLFSCGGGYLGYLITNTYRFDNEEKGSARRKLDDTRSFDLGIVAGFGWEASVQKGTVHLEYRYSMGFLDLPMSTDPMYIPSFRGIDFPTIELRNLCHAFTVGISFAIFER